MTMSNWYEMQKRRERRRRKSAGFTRQGDPYLPGQDHAVKQTSVPTVRVMRFTTLRGLFMPFFDKVISVLTEDIPVLEGAEVEHYRGSDVGFQLRVDDEDLIVDVLMLSRRGFIHLEIDGSYGDQDFSASYRVFQEDTIRKIAREIAIRIPV